jgi:2-polyprenyl-3-methyl-5-hydroxy-6-metoxy-1,4-benzoquinol methylase
MDTPMNTKTHWETVYQTKAPDAVSWYRLHLDISLQLIEQADPNRTASIIDVGGGESTLVDDLLAQGGRQVTVLDISETAVAVAKRRLDKAAAQVTWLVADITQAKLPERHYDVWHDRAVFHFMTAPEQRAAYVQHVAQSMKIGGHVIIATFGPQGPDMCSGLDVVRYDAKSLHNQFGTKFRLLDSSIELHTTPSGTMQQFLYCYCKVE